MIKKLFFFAITSIHFQTLPADDSFSFQQYRPQAELLVKQMTLEEKVGQMIVPTLEFALASKEKNTLNECKSAWTIEEDQDKLGKICALDVIAQFHLGAVLSAANPLPYAESQTIENWKKVAEIARSFYTGPQGTSLLLGTDSVHGNQHVQGAILFPHNIGLGATHNPDLIQQIGYWIGQDVLSTGFNWSYSPTVAISHDYRWGRTYESFSSDPIVVKAMAYSYVTGLQNIQDNKITGLVGTVKHFIGDGATRDGQDEGYAYEKDLEKFWKENGAGYEGAIAAHVGSMMASYSSLNDVPMHFGGDQDLLNQFKNQGILGTDKKTYQFKGFVVSDYGGVARAAYKYNLLHEKQLDYEEAVATAINAGMDMLMVASDMYIDPLDYEISGSAYKMHGKTFYKDLKGVQTALLQGVKNGLISLERLDDAVTRIIAVKLALAEGKIEELSATQKEKQREVALKAAEQSLVLLKNDQNLLPLKKEKIKQVFFLGAYDDIGIQNGGWTVYWQGRRGNKNWSIQSGLKESAAATSVKDGIMTSLDKNTHFYFGEESVNLENLVDTTFENSLAILVIGETPYAEYMGDVDNNNPWYKRGALGKENIYMPIEQSKFLGIRLSDAQTKAISALKKKGINVLTILFSGRPLVITDGEEKAPLQNSNAFIAAFLPGTTGGQAIANAIFGDYRFKSEQIEIEDNTYFSNTLPFAWPASMEEVVDHNYSLFSLGYGLGT